MLGIVKELEKRKILSITVKEKWCKRTIDVMISNEKYTGNVKLMKYRNSDVQYLTEDNNPAIISKKIFEIVQVEKAKRSSIVEGNDDRKRKNTKYSSKREN